LLATGEVPFNWFELLPQASTSGEPPLAILQELS
jgi:hypothetical protein